MVKGSGATKVFRFGKTAITTWATKNPNNLMVPEGTGTTSWFLTREREMILTLPGPGPSSQVQLMPK
jgi:hypothetical protein